MDNYNCEKITLMWFAMMYENKFLVIEKLGVECSALYYLYGDGFYSCVDRQSAYH